jgi:hypothetical protein
MMGCIRGLKKAWIGQGFTKKPNDMLEKGQKNGLVKAIKGMTQAP